jgi:UTP:GlnB (protein PII) uridylyltransferase
VNVRNAKIATLGTTAEDIFYITDSNNNMIEDTALLKKLEEKLLQALSSD